MQKNTPSKGTFIWLILIVVVSLLLFFYYKGTPNNNSTSSIENLNSIESSDAQAASARVIALLNQIKDLKIESSIFQSAVYKSLVDYSVAIPEQPVGRVNPFEPITGNYIPKPTTIIKLPAKSSVKK